MSVIIVTGSAGLVGSETVKAFHAQGLDVVGVDNNLRAYFFGRDASTQGTAEALQQQLPRYRHEAFDIRDRSAVDALFRRYGAAILGVVHTAAQPSHDWAAREPLTDFGVNAVGTLNLLEATRHFCPAAAFIFTSTNKVYGDLPNALPLVELPQRWELPETHPFHGGVNETMSIDQTKHSLFGVSKTAADLLVQEYGRYFDMKTTVFRGGCLTGPAHAGTELHGFLSYLMKCTVTGKPYCIFGYHGKQVRDNIHSHDLVAAFWECFQKPRCGEVYNIGGGRHANCSMLEAIALCEAIAQKTLAWTYDPAHRSGDHMWWISDVSKFQRHYPGWQYHYDLRRTLEEIFAACH